MFKSKQEHNIKCPKCKKTDTIPALLGFTIFTHYNCKCGFVVDIFKGKTPVIKIGGVEIKPATHISFNINQ